MKSSSGCLHATITQIIDKIMCDIRETVSERFCILSSVMVCVCAINCFLPLVIATLIFLSQLSMNLNVYKFGHFIGESHACMAA